MPTRGKARQSKKRRVGSSVNNSVCDFQNQGNTKAVEVLEVSMTDPIVSAAAAGSSPAPIDVASDRSETMSTPLSVTERALDGEFDDMPALLPLSDSDLDYDNDTDEWDIDDDDEDKPPPLEPALPLTEGDRVASLERVHAETTEHLSSAAATVVPEAISTNTSSTHPTTSENSLGAAHAIVVEADATSDNSDEPPPLEPISTDEVFDVVDVTAIVNPGYLPDEFIQRLSTIVNINDVGGARFSIPNRPATTHWGVDTEEDHGLSKILCYEGKPVSLWLVGRVKSLWFYTFGGAPQEKVYVALKPLRIIDLSATQELINGHTMPLGVAEMDTIYASRWMMSRSKGDTSHTPAPFTRVYNAVHKYGPKSTMKTISAAALGTHDIVLVECFLTRWKTDDNPKRSKTWTAWRCGLQLNSVSLLFSAPDTSNDIDLDVDDNIAFM